jgi:catechol 2,3-dioxygenase-like lactoylglutathione lyase family enzyme
MSQGVGMVGLYVRDQDEALAFYVEKLGFKVHTDMKNGDYRWLTVQQEPVERYGTVDAGFRDPSGNGWKMIQARG